LRDEFSEDIKRRLRERVGTHCSNPSCRLHTTGPGKGLEDVNRIGIAAHITAASPGGPRYNPLLKSEERSSIDNGIWLCSNCARLIDNDKNKYSTDILEEWKKSAEQNQVNLIENPGLNTQHASILNSAMILKIEKLTESIASKTKVKFEKMREVWREGDSVEPLEWINSLKDNIIDWDSLEDDIRAEIMRFEIKIRLEIGDNVEQLKKLAEEVKILNPSDDDLVVCALIVLYESGPEEAFKLLADKREHSLVNLKAALLLEMGRADESLELINSESQRSKDD